MSFASRSGVSLPRKHVDLERVGRGRVDEPQEDVRLGADVVVVGKHVPRRAKEIGDRARAEPCAQAARRRERRFCFAAHDDFEPRRVGRAKEGPSCLAWPSACYFVAVTTTAPVAMSHGGANAALLLAALL